MLTRPRALAARECRLCRPRVIGVKSKGLIVSVSLPLMPFLLSEAYATLICRYKHKACNHKVYSASTSATHYVVLRRKPVVSRIKSHRETSQWIATCRTQRRNGFYTKKLADTMNIWRFTLISGGELRLLTGASQKDTCLSRGESLTITLGDKLNID